MADENREEIENNNVEQKIDNNSFYEENKNSCIAILKSNKKRQIAATVVFSLMSAVTLTTFGGSIALGNGIAAIYLTTPVLLAVEETVRHAKNIKILNDMIKKLENNEYDNLMEKYDNHPNKYVNQAVELIKYKLNPEPEPESEPEEDVVFEEFNF